jgi:hypothetical protein
VIFRYRLENLYLDLCVDCKPKPGICSFTGVHYTAPGITFALICSSGWTVTNANAVTNAGVRRSIITRVMSTMFLSGANKQEDMCDTEINEVSLVENN